MTESITPAESVRLVELERVIMKHKDAVVEFGKALEEIRDKDLYRASHDTFEDYCRDRWNFGRNYVNKQIAAAQVIENLGTVVPTAPTNEFQARPLTKLPAEQQPAAWEKAVEKAAEEGKPVAARHVEEAVAEDVAIRGHCCSSIMPSEGTTPFPW